MRELIKHLKEEIEHLEALEAQRFEMPPQEVSLKEAAAKLRELLPDAYLGIKLELHQHSRREWEADWCIWDGNKNHSGPTLGAALQACILANQPKPIKAMETADALVGAAQIGF